MNNINNMNNIYIKELKIGIIGIGFVGNSLKESFTLKKINIVCYDKFKEYNCFNDCLDTNIIFLCLPTLFDEKLNAYDKSNIYEISERLYENKYKGLIVIKSTIEPNITDELSNKYPILKFIHNPEFLTARTAVFDFHNQNHIVLGKSYNITDNEIELLKVFYNYYYPHAEISICKCIESESMKIFCNSFYAVKIQFFNELYLLCKTNNTDYNRILELMLKNKWINPMHTVVPGPDGKLSYGGACFPKDTNALLEYMKINNCPSEVLNATINERNDIRNNINN